MVDSEFNVLHNLKANRFEVELPNEPAILVYMIRSDMMVLMHTEVPPAFEGKGIAAKMAKSALEFAKANKLKVRSFCSYTTKYLERHKEYQDLLG